MIYFVIYFIMYSSICIIYIWVIVIKIDFVVTNFAQFESHLRKVLTKICSVWCDWYHSSSQVSIATMWKKKTHCTKIVKFGIRIIKNFTVKSPARGKYGPANETKYEKSTIVACCSERVDQNLSERLSAYSFALMKIHIFFFKCVCMCLRTGLKATWYHKHSPTMVLFVHTLIKTRHKR